MENWLRKLAENSSFYTILYTVQEIVFFPKSKDVGVKIKRKFTMVDRSEGLKDQKAL